MQIFDSLPPTWQELQNSCAKILNEIGYETYIEKEVDILRGTVDIDVLALRNNPVKEKVIVECKHWSTPIPKTVAHSFRTIVSDYGANSGFIVSKMGFQSGVYDAVKNTNIQLMDFNEFQEYHKLSYLNSIITKLDKVGDPLRRYSDYIAFRWHKELSALPIKKRQYFEELVQKYYAIAPYSYMSSYTNEYDEAVPMYIDKIIIEVGKKFNPPNNILCYSGYFEWLMSLCEYGIKEFDDLFGQKMRKPS